MENIKEIFNPSEEDSGVMQTVGILSNHRLRDISERPKGPHYRISMGTAIPDLFLQALMTRYYADNMPVVRKFLADSFLIHNNFNLAIDQASVKVYSIGKFFWIAKEDVLKGAKIPEDWVLNEEVE